MNLVAAAVPFLLLFAAVEVLQRQTGIAREHSRKIAHIGAGLLVYFLPYYLTREEIAVLAAVFTLFLLVSRWLGLLPSLHRVERKTWGEIYFPIGVGISAWLMLPSDVRAFQFGVLVLALADAFGGIVGRRFGQHGLKVLGAQKSWEGSAVFFLTTLALYSALARPGTPAAIAGGAAAAAIITLAELCLGKGLDNMVLPVLAAFLFQLVA